MMEAVPAQPLPDVESTVAVKKEEDEAGPSTEGLISPTLKRLRENSDVVQGTKKCDYSNNVFFLFFWVKHIAASRYSVHC